MVATTMRVCLILLNRMLQNGQGGKFYPTCIWPKSKQKQNTSSGMQMGKLWADTARFTSRSVARLASSLWIVALFLGSCDSTLLGAGLLGWVEAPESARVTPGDGEEIRK